MEKDLSPIRFEFATANESYEIEFAGWISTRPVRRLRRTVCYLTSLKHSTNLHALTQIYLVVFFFSKLLKIRSSRDYIADSLILNRKVVDQSWSQGWKREIKKKKKRERKNVVEKWVEWKILIQPAKIIRTNIRVALRVRLFVLHRQQKAAT